MQQIDAFEAERRERGEASERAGYAEELPGAAVGELVLQEEMRGEADDEAADDVDDDRRDGKTRKRMFGGDDRLGCERGQIPGNGPDGAACRDGHNIEKHGLGFPL